jgi:hypothetical protein
MYLHLLGLDLLDLLYFVDRYIFTYSSASVRELHRVRLTALIPESSLEEREHLDNWVWSLIAVMREGFW